MHILLLNIILLLEQNFLVRKTCKHKEIFMCECKLPSFDVLLGDFDYTQKLGSPMLNPKSIGTRGYKAPQVSKLHINKHSY